METSQEIIDGAAESVPWEQYCDAVNRAWRLDERLGSLTLLAMQWEEEARSLEPDCARRKLMMEFAEEVRRRIRGE